MASEAIEYLAFEATVTEFQVPCLLPFVTSNFEQMVSKATCFEYLGFDGATFDQLVSVLTTFAQLASEPITFAYLGVNAIIID